MPTYDYECQSCGHRFEHFGKIHEMGLRACPNCHKKKAKRMIGAGSGFIFKGSGFYVTDSKGSSHAAATAKQSESKAETKAETNADAKPSSESKPKKKSD
jgi:putative FmdB family regulatory protein